MNSVTVTKKYSDSENLENLIKNVNRKRVLQPATHKSKWASMGCLHSAHGSIYTRLTKLQQKLMATLSLEQFIQEFHPLFVSQADLGVCVTCLNFMEIIFSAQWDERLSWVCFIIIQDMPSIWVRYNWIWGRTGLNLVPPTWAIYSYLYRV